MLKQTKAGKTVSETDIPPPIAVSRSPAGTFQHGPPPSGNMEIPRPTVVHVSGGHDAAMPPVAKPRVSVQQPPVQQPVSSRPTSGSGINVARTAANAPPVQLHTGPASDATTGTVTF